MSYQHSTEEYRNFTVYSSNIQIFLITFILNCYLMSFIDFSGPEIRQTFFIVAEKRQRTDILNIDHLNTLLRIPIWWSDYLAEQN